MSEYIIEYNSHNVYTEPVSEGIFEFKVSPCNDGSQILIHESIENSLSESIFTFNNSYNFEVNRVKTSKKFESFKFTYKAIVQKKKSRLPSGSPYSIKEEEVLLASLDFYIDHHLFLTKSPFAVILPANVSKILVYKKNISVFEYLQQLNKYVHSLLSYQKNVTDVKTTADTALKQKKGVCQDYAHIFIAMSRHNCIPCRYVSGYINQGKKFLGDAFMHAWVEAFIPGLGWVGFDPTNNLLVDDNFIKVAHGADYSDCSPIKGVIRTNGENKTSYQVKVSAR